MLWHVVKNCLAPSTVQSKKGNCLMVRKVVRKPQKDEDETQILHSANTTARVIGEGKKGSEPPKIHAKVLQFTVSVGTEDRDRSIEDFIAFVEKRLKVPGVKRVTKMSGYYILDGKVCLPDDYDHKTGTFKPGAVPPPWAGGPLPQSPKPQHAIGGGIGHKTIPREEAERRIALAKAKYEAHHPAKESDDGLEEWEWDEGDLTDEEEHDAVVEEMTRKAVRKVRKKVRKGGASSSKA